MLKKRIFLLVGGTLAALLLAISTAEILGRTGMILPAEGGMDPLRLLPAARVEAGGILTEEPSLYRTDRELGYMPVLGRGRYSELGTLINEYALPKSPHRKRILFIGDSAVYLGKLVRAIADVLDEDATEVWNGGVRGYNTIQEVAYYRRYLKAISPDHVILVFHNNDFDHTPVAFRDDTGFIRVYSPARPLGVPFYPSLFTHSWLYQRWILARAFRDAPNRNEIVELVRKSLVELDAMTKGDGAALTILVLPQFKPYAEWTEEERWSRETALALFRDLDFHFYDLMPALEATLAAGEPADAVRGDFNHPSDAVSQRIAEYISTTPGENAPPL